MYVCLCFGVTEQQVHAQIEAGACSPRQIASACRAGTDCGGCVKRIQSMLGRPAVCPRRAPGPADCAPAEPQPEVGPEARPSTVPVPEPVAFVPVPTLRADAAVPAAPAVASPAA